MPKFRYKAQKEDGSFVEGTADVTSEAELATNLQRKGLTLVNASADEQQMELSTIDSYLLRFTSIKLIDKVFFIQHLEVMLRSGFSIGRALRTLALQTSNKRFQVIIGDIRGKVESGVAFSKALRNHPKVFPELIVNMIEAGELSGKLDSVLKQITIQLRKEHTLKSKVRGALIYPIIVLMAMVGIGIAMIIFVIPKITDIYEEADAELPLMTKVLIGVSKFSTENGLLMLLGSIAIVVMFIRVIRTDTGKWYYHRLVLRLPVVGPIAKKINLAQFSRTFTSLLQTDVPIVTAFKIISKTVGNVVYRRFFDQAADELKKGKPISTLLSQDTKLFPPMTTQMVTIGEESGTLDTTTEEIASFYEEDVDQTMANLSTIIEPILMLVLGVGVGGMAIAIIMPMYNITNAI